MRRFITWMGGSTTARFGFTSIFIAIILFAIPSACYFLHEGGVIMPSWIGIAVGIFLIVVLVVSFVLLTWLWCLWIRDGLTDTTPQRLSNIEKVLTRIESKIDRLVVIRRRTSIRRKSTKR